jgi:CheY-like chemotaxis protein
MTWAVNCDHSSVGRMSKVRAEEGRGMSREKTDGNVVFNPTKESESLRLSAETSQLYIIRAPKYGGIESLNRVKGGIVKAYIVDDSEVVIERLKTMLSELKEIEIIGQANNPFDAINGIRTLKPDVVTLDLQMPGGSGIGVLLSTKRDDPSPTVLILTNYPYPQYRKKCMEAGADFFFDKSTEFEKIPEVLKGLVQNPKWRARKTDSSSENENI